MGIGGDGIISVAELGNGVTEEKDSGPHVDRAVVMTRNYLWYFTTNGTTYGTSRHVPLSGMSDYQSYWSSNNSGDTVMFLKNMLGIQNLVGG